MHYECINKETNGVRILRWFMNARLWVRPMKCGRINRLLCISTLSVARFCSPFQFPGIATFNSIRHIVSALPTMKRDHDDCQLSSAPVTDAVTDAMSTERETFVKFIEARNWRFSEGFWSRIIKHSSHTLPAYIAGTTNAGYGVTSLQEIHETGARGEFQSKNTRYHIRQTFAACIGYDGNQYHGYQKQKFCPGLTVEGDIFHSMGFNTIGAGRTDRGVSAVSQVLCFATTDMTKTPEGMLEKFRASEPVLEGRLAVYDCKRVPKKFHARSSATWRRYLYMFPLKRVDDAAVEVEGQPGVYTSPSTGATYDVDMEYLNKVLGRLENVELPFNAFAFKLDRAVGNGLLDKCILYKARASVVNLADIAPGVAWAPVPTPIPLDTSRNHKVQKTQHDRGGPTDIDMDNTNFTSTDGEDTVNPMLGDKEAEENGVEESMSIADSGGTELVAAVDSAVPTQPPSNKPADNKNKARKADESGDYHAGFVGDARDGDVDDVVDEAFSLARSGANGAGQAGADDSVDVPLGAEIPAICIELVGNRFLRRMVRILTATAIREAIKKKEERNENILVEICHSGDRDRPARALPGPPLALSGVGYDLHDLAIYKFMPKAEHNAVMAKKKDQYQA